MDIRQGRRSASIATPSASEFDDIRVKVAQHLLTGVAREPNCRRANELWMLVGFAIFEELARLAPCLEVFPQATVRAMSLGRFTRVAPEPWRRNCRLYCWLHRMAFRPCR